MLVQATRIKSSGAFAFHIKLALIKLAKQQWCC
jgi:hypothetical protein